MKKQIDTVVAVPQQKTVNGQQEQSLQIKQEGKFFSRLLSKESSRSNSSFRDRVPYYGGSSGSVPFLWELQPGTPKHPLTDSSSLIPPLTPPPSYRNSNSNSIVAFNRSSDSSKPTHLGTTMLFLCKKKKKSNHISPSSSVSSSSYSSSSSWSSSANHVGYDYGSPKPTLMMCCVGGRGGGNGGGRVQKRVTWKRFLGATRWLL